MGRHWRISASEVRSAQRAAKADDWGLQRNLADLGQLRRKSAMAPSKGQLRQGRAARKVEERVHEDRRFIARGRCKARRWLVHAIVSRDGVDPRRKASLRYLSDIDVWTPF